VDRDRTDLHCAGLLPALGHRAAAAATLAIDGEHDMKSARTDKAARTAPADTLNTIGVLKRREIEARILKPLLEAMANEFGRDRVFAIAQRVVVAIAHEQGASLAAQVGGCSLAQFAGALDDWQKGDAYRLDVLEQNDRKFSFNVTRCRYAEMYRS